MASNYVEKIHEKLLKKLIEESGLECMRVHEESVGSETVEAEIEQQEPTRSTPTPRSLVVPTPRVYIKSAGARSDTQGRPQELLAGAHPESNSEHPEWYRHNVTTTVEEEQAVVEEAVVVEPEPESEDEIEEERPIPFPTPSLRLVLPDKVRKIQGQNRLQVLPEEFNKDIDPLMIPKINKTPHQKYIDILGEMVGCTNYKKSLAEFWFLDTLANLLRRAQEDQLNRATQALLILWFCEWMKEMQHFDAADRERMQKRFQDNMLTAARYIATEMQIPSPADVGVYYKALETAMSNVTVTTGRSVVQTMPRQPSVTFETTPFECAMRDLTKITHYIYDLFSTDYQYDLVRSVFCFTPDYIHIESPYQIQIPKRLYAPMKPKKEKSPKKEKTKDAKGKKKEPDTEEFLALMELKAKEELELEELLDRSREEFNKRNSILPLNFAATQELFDKYWPPPTPEPEPESEPEPPKPKPKGKKKK